MPPPPLAPPPTVLFLCVHNAGRSQMAAGWLRHLGGERVRVLSAGSEPATSINPRAVTAMREVGIDITDRLPARWTDASLAAADVVVTMGCGDTCPVVPATRYLDWQLDDPSVLDADGVARVRDEIEQHVRTLMGELGIDPSGDPAIDPAGD